jgi:aminopeptidase-like protein
MFAAEASPLAPLVTTVTANVENGHTLDTMRRVYSSDRWFTFPKFEETAAYLKQRLEQGGLAQVEIGGARADGTTQAGFWTMPLAWDVRRAKLEMTAPEKEVLCDYQAVPASLGMWSGPTPAGGVDTEIVDLEKTGWEGVRGKLVLTDKNAANYKFQLVNHGALGSVNGFSENPALRDGRQWVNAWGDDGWGFTKASTPLLSYSITPRQVEHLKRLLAEGKHVVVHAEADTRFYDGRYPWVTAVLPGTQPEEEVLALGHTSEQGAQDNATGVAAVVEAVTTLNRLITAGKLPRPARSIRVLLMPEMYGSLSYIAANRERMRHTVAAMTVDTPAASYGLSGTEYTFYLNPHVAMSYTDALIKRVADAALSGHRIWHWKEQMPGTDSYLGEPTVDVPTVWSYSGTGIETHHNSEDKPADVDERSLHDLVTVLASYLYFNANAGEAQIPWLAEITLDHVYEEIGATVSKGLDALRAAGSNDALRAAGSNDALRADQLKAGSFALERVAYFQDRGEYALSTALRLVPEKDRARIQKTLAPYIAQLRAFCALESDRLRQAGAVAAPRPTFPGAEIVVKRKRFGTIPLDDLAQDQWKGFPSGAWDKRVITALYWCDGKRNLAEVVHLTQMELGPLDFDFVGYFRFLQRHGYVDFAN